MVEYDEYCVFVVKIVSAIDEEIVVCRGKNWIIV